MGTRGGVLTEPKSPRYCADREHSEEGRHGLLSERAERAWVYSAGERCPRPRRFVPLLVRKTLCLFNSIFFFLFKYFSHNDYCGCLCMCAYVNMGTHGAMARAWSGAPLFWDSACFFTLFLRQDLYAPGCWPASFQEFLLFPI